MEGELSTGPALVRELERQSTGSFAPTIVTVHSRPNPIYPVQTQSDFRDEHTLCVSPATKVILIQSAAGDFPWRPARWTNAYPVLFCFDCPGNSIFLLHPGDATPGSRADFRPPGRCESNFLSGSFREEDRGPLLLCGCPSQT